MQLVAQTIVASTTMTSSTEVDMLPGGTSGWNPNAALNSTGGNSGPGADTILITLKETGGSNAINTVKVYVSSGAVSYSSTGVVTTSALVPLSTTTSVSASGTRQILLKGYAGGPIRVTGNSTSGATGYADAASYYTGEGPAFQYAFDGVVQAQSSGGTIVGNFSATGGTITENATGAATFDASTSVTIGGTNATSVVVGQASVVPSFPGGLTIAAAKSVDTTAAGALNIGNSTATSIVVGAASVAPSFPGGLTVAAGKAVTGGSGTLTVDTTGALQLGTSLATSIVAGAATIPVDAKGGLQCPSGDAGAAGTSGTVSKPVGTFTLTGTTFALTNTYVGTTSIPIVTCITAAPGAYIASVVPTSNLLTVTMSTSVTSMKFAFAIIASGG